MANPVISVIVPVYNLAEPVAACLRSLLVQSFRDFELIAMDDGSTDGSLAVLQALAEEDARIRVLHQENQGVSMARNNALAEARGDWIVFVDADDTVAEDYLQALWSLVEDGQADWGILNVGTKEENPGIVWDSRVVDYTGQDLVDEMLRVAGTFQTYNWNKIFKKSILDAAGIRFLPGNAFGEDYLFVYEYACRAAHARLLMSPPDRYYYYDVREGSLSHHFSSRKCLDAMVISEKLLEVNGRFSNMNEKALTYVRWRHAIYAMRYLETLYTETRHLDRKLIRATLKKVVPNLRLLSRVDQLRFVLLAVVPRPFLEYYRLRKLRQLKKGVY